MSDLLHSFGLREYLLRSHPLPEYIQSILDISPDLSAHVFINNLAISSLPPGSRILDLGCGGLDKTLALCELGFRCTALDDFNDPWHIASYPSLYSRAQQLGINVLSRDLSELVSSWGLGSYEFIMLNDVIEHLAFSPLPLLQCCINHLSPHGILMLHVPSSVNLKKRIKCLFGRSIYPPPDQFFMSEGLFRGHIREYDRNDLLFLSCHLSGFYTSCLTPVSNMIGVVPRSLRPLCRPLFALFPDFQDSWRLVIRMGMYQ